MVLEIRIGLQEIASPEQRATTAGVAQEQPAEATAQFVGDFVQRQPNARTGRAFHLDPIAIIAIEAAQALNQQVVCLLYTSRCV